MSKRLITPVINNADKQRTYSEQIGRYNRAMREGFYLEALLIDYALIEDRLRSMIYHMGFIANRTAKGIYKRTRPYLKEIVLNFKGEKEAEKLGISNISGKIKIVQSVLLWSKDSENLPEDKFARELMLQTRKMNLDELLIILGEILKWCEYRNEVVHALMNKNIDSFEVEIKSRAEDGMRMARFLDSQVKILKLRDRVRKAINLPKA